MAMVLALTPISCPAFVPPLLNANAAMRALFTCAFAMTRRHA
jgi:hypothetical protein